MRITGVTSRILGYDLREAHPNGRIPDELHDPIRAVSFDTFHTDEGLDGWTMQFGGLGEGRAIGHVLHETYVPGLIGKDPRNSEAIWQQLRRTNRHMYNVTDAIMGAIDVAMWDLRGKWLGQPIGALLGLARERIPTYATARTWDPTPEEVFAEAQLRRSEGFRGFKIQFWDGLERDIPRFRAAREAVGPDFPLMEDAAGQYDYLTAIKAGHELQRLGYTWFEEPIPDRQGEQLRRLADQLDIPILAFETLRLGELAGQLRLNAGDIARGDVLLSGGVTGLRKALATCEVFGWTLEIHAIGSVLLDIANLHVGLSVENCSFMEAQNPVFALGVKGLPLAIDADGCRTLPDAPGLGVEMDWDWIDDHTLEVIRTGDTPS